MNDEQNMLFGGWCTWFQRGVRGGGGVNDVRCGLQTKMMLFGGWWTKHVVRWMMHLVSKGGFKGVVRGGVGGLMTFVVDCKPRWCCLVDDEQNMLFGGWCIWFQRGGSGWGWGVWGVNDVRCGLQTKMMLFGAWWTKHVVWWMMNKTCCSVDDAFGFKGRVRGGWGGLMTFVVDCKPRWCCLVDDEQNMLFGGWCTWFQRGGSGGWGG